MAGVYHLVSNNGILIELELEKEKSLTFAYSRARHCAEENLEKRIYKPVLASKLLFFAQHLQRFRRSS